MNGPRERQGLDARERAVGFVTLVGLGMALGAVAAILAVGPLDALLVVFWCGWAVVGAGAVAALFVVRTLPGVAKPMMVAGLGVIVVVTSFVMEALAGVPMRGLRLYGSTVFLVGMGWVLWRFGDR